MPARVGSNAWPGSPRMCDPRRRAMAAFLGTAGWGDVSAIPLAADASFRRYYRLGGDGSSAVLMDAPPPQEDVGAYVVAARLLRDLGFSAPEVLAEDRDRAFCCSKISATTPTRGCSSAAATSPPSIRSRSIP
jgi:hypothetical protein